MKRWIYRSVLGLTTLLTIGAVTGCSHKDSDSPVSHLPAPVTEGGMTLNWGGDVKTQALQMIEGSKSFVQLDIYELSDQDILQALIAAHRRHVDVQVVVDATEEHSTSVGIPTLRHAGVPVRSLRIPRGINHIKMLIADGKHSGVLIGGMNFGSMSWSNNDASVYLREPNSSFRSLFRWDWQRASGEPATSPEYLAPLLDDRTTEEQVIRAIQNAQHSVYLEAFDLSDRPVIAALKAAVNRGVLVEVLLDPGQHLNKAVAVDLRDAGATVRFYLPYQAEWMHAKILDVDHGATFIIGSANFSHQAYTYNHEGDIELHHVPLFDKSLEDDLSIQVSRGTDYPQSHVKGW